MMDERHGIRYVTAVAVGAAFGGFLFGFDTSTLNAAMTGIRGTLDMSAGATGLIAAISLPGCAVGAWFAGPISTNVGRPRVMALAGAVLTGGALVSAASASVPVMGAARCVTGLGIGAVSAVVPAYISEISPTHIRGRLGSLWQFALVVGQLIGLLSGYVLTWWAGGEGEPLFWNGEAWRWMFAVVAALAALYFVTARGLPISPTDLVRRGDIGSARALLARLGDDEGADRTIAAIREHRCGHGGVPTLADLRGPRLGLQSIVWTGLLLAAFQQLLGINIVKTYSNTLWQAVGFSTAASFTISVVTILVSIASTAVAIALIDRVGRRALLIAGAAVMALSLGALAACFATATDGEGGLSLSHEVSIAALVAINIFAMAFGVSWGPVMWVMLSELFDSSLRTPAVAVCTAANWMVNWAVTRTFPLMASAGLSVAYGAYTVFAVLAFFFALRALPETRGRSLS